MALDLLKRGEQTPDLTATQYDETLTRIENEVNAKAPVDSPVFLNAPRGPTPPAGDNSTRLATTAWVQTLVAGLPTGGPGVTDGDKGDVTVSGSGTVWTIDNGAVSLAKMANRTAGTLLGRAAGAGTGAPQEITLGSNLSLSGSTLSAAAGSSTAGPYVGQRSITASANLTSTDVQTLVQVSGSNVTLTLVSTGVPTLSWIDVVNTNADDGTLPKVVTITAGVDNLNASGTTSIQLAPGDTVRLVKIATAVPMWRSVGAIGFLALAANQFMVVASSGAAQQARADRVALDFLCPHITANGTFPLGFWPYQDSTMVSVSCRTLGGTCSVRIIRAGTAIQGFGTAVAQVNSRTTTNSTQAVAEEDLFQVEVTAAAALTGLAVALKAVRTATTA